MKINRITNIDLEINTYMHFSSNEELGTVNLYLSGYPETISIQFLSDHLPQIEMLVTEMQRIKHSRQAQQLAELQRQIDALSIVSENGASKNGTKILVEREPTF